MAFDLMGINSINHQICAETCHFLDLSLAIGGHPENNQIKKNPLGEI